MHSLQLVGPDPAEQKHTQWNKETIQLARMTHLATLNWRRHVMGIDYTNGEGRGVY
jgi:hypothetical protein